MERWAEASGNAGLAGRELPPADVHAADQKITWWARQLRAGGLECGIDQLRARALMDLSLLGRDVTLVESGVAVDLFAQFRVPVRLCVPVLRPW